MDGEIYVGAKSFRGRLKLTEYKCTEEYCTKSGDKGYFVEGYASTDDLDLEGDVITKEALERVVEEIVEDPYNKLFLMHNTHDIPIGKVVAARLEGSKLWIRAKLNPAHPMFESVWQSLKEGYLSAFSIQFIILDYEEGDGKEVRRFIKRIKIIEVSLVGVPANPGALVTSVEEKAMKEVKGAVPSHSPPGVERGGWDKNAAIARLRKWASSDGSGDKDKIDWNKYAKGFAWYDSNDRENFGAYKLPHHDVVDGRLVTVWEGVAAAMAALRGARGGVDIPQSDRPAVYRHLARHYRQFGREPPGEKEVLKSLFESDNQKESETMSEELEARIKELEEQLEEKDRVIQELSEQVKRYEEAEAQRLREKIAEIDPEAETEGKSIDELKDLYLRTLEKAVKMRKPQERAPVVNEGASPEPEEIISYS